MVYPPDQLEPYRFESFRKLAKFLKKQPEIACVKLHAGKYLHVKYKNGFTEHWTWDRELEGRFTYYIIPDNKQMYQFDNNWPEFRCQFTRVYGEEEYEKKGKFFLYTHKYLSKFRFANRKVFLNRLSNQLAEEGYIRPWFPKENIKRIINKINECILVDKLDDHTYVERCRPAFLAQSLSVMTKDSTAPAEWNSYNICCAIHRLFNRKIPITRNSIIWSMRKTQRCTYDRGFPIALAMFLRDKYPNKKIINKTGLYWVDVAVVLYSNGNNQDGGEVDIVTKWDDDNRGVILGEGDYEFVSGFHLSGHSCKRLKVGIK